MSLVKEMMNEISFLITGKAITTNLTPVCNFVPGYFLSPLSFNGRFIEGKVGIRYSNTLLTTFSYYSYYEIDNGKVVRKKIPNEVFNCYLEDVYDCCLYENSVNYFHLPDLIPAYLIRFKKPFYLFSNLSYGYYNGKNLVIYNYPSIPHYVFFAKLEPTEELDKLLFIVGITDAYKRFYIRHNLSEKEQEKYFKLALDYVFKPFVYYAYFLKTKSTLLKCDLEKELEWKLKPLFIKRIEEKLKPIYNEINKDFINERLKNINLKDLLIVQ